MSARTTQHIPAYISGKINNQQTSVVLVMQFTFSFSFSQDVNLLLVLVLTLVKMSIYL